MIDDENQLLEQKLKEARRAKKRSTMSVAQSLAIQALTMGNTVTELVHTQTDLMQQRALVQQLAAMGKLDEIFGETSAIMAELDKKVDAKTMTARVAAFKNGVNAALERNRLRTAAQADASKGLDKANKARDKRQGRVADDGADMDELDDRPEWQKLLEQDEPRRIDDAALTVRLALLQSAVQGQQPYQQHAPPPPRQ